MKQFVVFAAVLGILRAMADDYGALVLLEHQGRDRESDVISIRLVDVSFAEGRVFQLGTPQQ